jgi:2'-5' RNA ligase
MKYSSGSHRYFIAIIPPEPIFSEAQRLKEHCKEIYHSKASLNSPPHITLHMPFLWKEKKEIVLTERLTIFASTQRLFDLRIKNFNAFSPRVIYMDVVASEGLSLFQKELERFCKRSFQLFNANRLDHAYHPHITLAFRDLKKDQFALAWNEFNSKKFEATCTVDKFALLKHNGSVWNVLTEFSLADSV